MGVIEVHLPDIAAVVPVVIQHIGQRPVVRVHIDFIYDHPRRADVFPGKQARPVRRGYRAHGQRTGKIHRIMREIVDIGGDGFRIAGISEYIGPHLVSKDEYEIRTLLVRRRQEHR